MAVRTCSVSFVDARGVRHTVDVQAETLFEGAAAALALFRADTWIEDRPGPATHLEIEVRAPAVRHTVTIQQIERWAESTAVTPADRLKRNVVKKLLG